MSKRHLPYGTIETPTGPVRVTNKHVARTLENLQRQAMTLRDHWQREASEHQETRQRLKGIAESNVQLATDLRAANERLAKLQNRVWVRIGEALGIIRP